MTRTLASTAGRLALAAVALSAVDAQAIPSFARKYGTSCQTCHTVYPKLNPFGEAFRRRGYRFPGVDADAVAEQPQPLGQDWQARAFPKTIWPGTLPATAPLAMGFDGQAALHPDAHSGGAVADGEAPVTLHDLAGAAHVWAGGSYDQWITFLAELSFSSARGFQFETAQVHFNDLIGPPNLVNLTVGQGHATLNSFAASSSYLVDDALPAASLAGLFGASSAGPALNDNTAGVEVSGVVKGRFDYAVGVNAGSNVVMQVSDDFYAHVGLKLGGLGLDGSNTGGAGDPGQPGAETALTLDLFGCRCHSRVGAAGLPGVADDVALVGGGAVRAQVRAVELDSGLYMEHHDHAQTSSPAAGRAGAELLVQYDELSWLALPWLVPAVRFELFRATPDGGPAVWDAKVTPGVSALVRPNLKLQLLAQFETAHGAPPAGWSLAGSYAAPTPGRPRIGLENEAVWVRLATAF